MALRPGVQLGAYEIVALIGAGGMGQVYRAPDTRLKRDVAIKVLLEEFASDPERLACFEGETKLLATLNSPVIAAIYCLEESNGIRALSSNSLKIQLSLIGSHCYHLPGSWVALNLGQTRVHQTDSS